MMTKTIIFDYDGTIHHTLGIYEPAFRETYQWLTEQKVTEEREIGSVEIAGWLGLNSKEMWNTFLPELDQSYKEQASRMVGDLMVRQIRKHKAVWYPGADASKHLPDDVPEEVKIRRLNEIIELQNRLSAESNARDVGKTFEVMVEGVSKRSREQLFGRTQQNKVVVFDRGNHRIGDFVHVRITEASSVSRMIFRRYWHGRTLRPPPVLSDRTPTGQTSTR